MRTIFKWALPIMDTATIPMPRFARPIAVAEQAGALCLWAEVDANEPLVNRDIHIRGTGNPLLGNEGRHIGSVVMSYGLVWHCYEDAEMARERGVQ